MTKLISVGAYTSGTIYHMILIYGTHVSIKGHFFSFFFFFQNFDFWYHYGGGGKRAKNGKKLCLFHSVSQELQHHMIMIFGTNVKMMISPAIFFIYLFQFSGFLGW